MTNQPDYVVKAKHTYKTYAEHLHDDEAHHHSIMERHGMPPKAKPPELPEDIVEKIMAELAVTPERWNRGI